MRGTRVWDLVWEDPTCCGATKPVSHNYWACVPQLLKPARLEPVLHNEESSPQSPQLEKACVQQWRPNATKKKKKKKILPRGTLYEIKQKWIKCLVVLGEESLGIFLINLSFCLWLNYFFKLK